MRRLPINSLFILISTVVISVQADYSILLQLEAFSNPRFLLASGRCCSDSSLTENCPASCEDRLEICLRDAAHPRLLDTCPLLNIENLPSNPRSLTLPSVSGPWPLEDGVQLLITITDANSGELVDTVLHILEATPGNLSQSIDVTGDLALVELTFSFEVTCDKPFFGPECNTMCIERDDSSGHFTCNPDDGSIVCLPGYNNVTSNCLECATAEGCSEEGGFCEGPGECQCREGYSGVNCSIAPTTSFSFSLLPSTTLLPMTSDVDLFTTSSINLLTTAPVSSDINLIATSSPLQSTAFPNVNIMTTTSPSPLFTMVQISSLRPSSIESSSTESFTTLSLSTIIPTLAPSTSVLNRIALSRASTSTVSNTFTVINVGKGGLSPGATAGLTVGILVAIIILALVAIAVVIIAFYFILKRRHRRKVRRWYLTESTNSTMETDVVHNKYASGTHLIPHHNGTSPKHHNGISSTPQPELKSVNQNRPWYHETDPELPSIFRFIDDPPVAPAYDTETVFSDATFDTLSRHSAVSENVVYADIIRPKPRIKELTSDEIRIEKEEDEEEDEQEIQDSVTNSDKVPPAQRISYTEVTFQEN